MDTGHGADLHLDAMASTHQRDSMGESQASVIPPVDNKNPKVQSPETTVSPGTVQGAEGDVESQPNEGAQPNEGQPKEGELQPASDGDLPSSHSPWLLPPWPPPLPQEGVGQDMVSSYPRPPDHESLRDDIVVCRLTSPSMLSIQAQIEDILVKAVVDTAAEVTIISDRIYNNLHQKPPLIKKVTLNTAGREMKMTGMIVGPLDIKLGEHTLNEIVYVAPITDDMLLGVDLLRKHGASINIPTATLSLKGRDIRMTSEGGSNCVVSEVTVHKTVSIPARTATRVTCQVYPPNNKLLLIEPTADLIGLVPRTLHEGKPIVDIYVINPTDNLVYWKQGQVVGKAQEANLIEPTKESADVNVRRIDLSTEYKIPPHLQDLWERSIEHLSEQEQGILKGLFLEFEEDRPTSHAPWLLPPWPPPNSLRNTN